VRPWAGNGANGMMAPVPRYHADDPRSAIERPVESSGTTHGIAGAVGGQLAGAFYGESRSPIEWRTKPARRPMVVTPAECLSRGHPLSRIHPLVMVILDRVWRIFR
jgi:hypothetical protein